MCEILSATCGIAHNAMHSFRAIKIKTFSLRLATCRQQMVDKIDKTFASNHFIMSYVADKFFTQL